MSRGDGEKGSAAIDRLVTEHARTFCPEITRKLATRLLHAVGLCRADRFDPQAFPRRERPARQQPQHRQHRRFRRESRQRAADQDSPWEPWAGWDETPTTSSDGATAAAQT